MVREPLVLLITIHEVGVDFVASAYSIFSIQIPLERKQSTRNLYSKRKSSQIIMIISGYSGYFIDTWISRGQDKCIQQYGKHVYFRDKAAVDSISRADLMSPI